jgi:hypothetical protein
MKFDWSEVRILGIVLVPVLLLQMATGIERGENLPPFANNTKNGAHASSTSKKNANASRPRTKRRVNYSSGIIAAVMKSSSEILMRTAGPPAFRFNNRKNPYLFRDTILKLIASSALEYEELTASKHEAA